MLLLYWSVLNWEETSVGMPRREKRPANRPWRLWLNVLAATVRLLLDSRQPCKCLRSDNKIGTTQLMVTVLSPWVIIVASEKGSSNVMISFNWVKSRVERTRFSWLFWRRSVLMLLWSNSTTTLSWQYMLFQRVALAEGMIFPLPMAASYTPRNKELWCIRFESLQVLPRRSLAIVIAAKPSHTINFKEWAKHDMCSDSKALSRSFSESSSHNEGSSTSTSFPTETCQTWLTLLSSCSMHCL